MQNDKGQTPSSMSRSVSPSVALHMAHHETRGVAVERPPTDVSEQRRDGAATTPSRGYFHHHQQEHHHSLLLSAKQQKPSSVEIFKRFLSTLPRGVLRGLPFLRPENSSVREKKLQQNSTATAAAATSVTHYLSNIAAHLGISAVLLTFIFILLWLISPSTALNVPIFGDIAHHLGSSSSGGRKSSSSSYGSRYHPADISGDGGDDSIDIALFLEDHRRQHSSNTGASGGGGVGSDEVVVVDEYVKQEQRALNTFRREELHALLDGSAGRRSMAHAILKKRLERALETRLYGKGGHKKAKEKGIPHPEIAREIRKRSSRSSSSSSSRWDKHYGRDVEDEEEIDDDYEAELHSYQNINHHHHRGGAPPARVRRGHAENGDNMMMIDGDGGVGVGGGGGAVPDHVPLGGAVVGGEASGADTAADGTADASRKAAAADDAAAMALIAARGGAAEGIDVIAGGGGFHLPQVIGKVLIKAEAGVKRFVKKYGREGAAMEQVAGILADRHKPINNAPWALREVFNYDASIFVSIAQFKDILCPFTIQELYTQARNPRRIFAGIVDQREYNLNETIGGIGSPSDYRSVDPNNLTVNLDGTCFPWYMHEQCGLDYFCPTDNIRVRHAFPHEGKGPTWGRYYGMLMYQGESYFMMIDSHSRFAKNYDVQIMINLFMVEKESKGRAILSHYPPTFERYESLISHRGQEVQMTMCAAHYQSFGVIRMDSVNVMSKGFPTPQPFSAGGFLVGDAQFVHECPFDPYLTFVFDGEEILYSVRLWTHGFDLYTPRNNIVFHHYGRHKAPRFWSTLKSRDWVTQQVVGQARVKYFMQAVHNQTNITMVNATEARRLGVDREEEIYGLGKARPLEAYYKYANIDPSRWTVNDGDLRCGKWNRGEFYRKYHRRADGQPPEPPLR